MKNYILKMQKSIKYFFICFIVLIPLGTVFSEDRSNYLYVPDISGMSGPDAMIAIAQANLERKKDDIGYSGGWCDWFVHDVAKRAGQSSAIPSAGGVQALYNGIIAAGGVPVNSPQRGDIVFYGTAHAAIMADSVNAYHGNLCDCGDEKCTFYINCRVRYLPASRYTGASGITGYLRPNYKSVDTVKPVISVSRIENITNTSYDVYLKGTDNLSQKLKFQIRTWNDNMSINDAKLQTSEFVSSKEIRFTVKISDFGNAKDVTYHTNAYVIDESGNTSDAIRVGDPYIASLIGDLSCDWIETTILPDNVTTSNCEIQYNNHYEKKATNSPGSGYVQTGSPIVEYENSGGEYESGIKLATSPSTRKEVRYYYYHFCGSSTGTNADHVIRNGYVHWDMITDVNSVVAQSGYPHPDDTDKDYEYYRLNWKTGGEAKCKSGVTCDGSNGTHGERSNVWYKMYIYQDLKEVTYYTWVKDSGWTSSRDSSATSVTIRYRLKSGSTCPRGLVLPAGLKEIQSSAFEGSKSIEEVTIPNGVTTIGSRAFANCTNLTLVNIPSSVTSIGANAFLNDSKVVLNCQSNSVCVSYAQQYGISYRVQ